VAAILVLGLSLLSVVRPASAQTSTTTPTDETVTIPDTTLDGGPLLVPGDVDPTASSAAAGDTNNDNTGTVVALVISGLLVVALLLALLTYWFWRNTRPAPVPARDDERINERVGDDDG
jgi:hypothetical protein